MPSPHTIPPAQTLPLSPSDVCPSIDLLHEQNRKSKRNLIDELIVSQACLVSGNFEFREETKKNDDEEDVEGSVNRN